MTRPKWIQNGIIKNLDLGNDTWVDVLPIALVVIVVYSLIYFYFLAAYKLAEICEGENA
jgi:hypothetical protein